MKGRDSPSHGAMRPRRAKASATKTPVTPYRMTIPFPARFSIDMTPRPACFGRKPSLYFNESGGAPGAGSHLFSFWYRPA